MKKVSYLFLFFSLGYFAQAQDVALSYELDQLNETSAKMQVYLHSLTDESQALKAINFSLALPAGCAEVTGQQSIFADSWTQHLEEIQVIVGLEMDYNNWHYSQRWQYGSADPGLPGTAAIIAPAQGEAPVWIMEISLKGSCLEKAYLEQQSENPINQMGDAQVQPMDWTVIHPQTELELEQGSSLEIFPNPVKDFLNLSFEGTAIETYQIQLVSSDGKVIQAKLFDPAQEANMKFDMRSLPAAMYLLSIQKEGEAENVQWMKILKH